MAHRLARVVYRMLKYGQEYVDKGTQFYEQRLREQQLQSINKKAATLGLRLVEVEEVA
jgi:transposase